MFLDLTQIDHLLIKGQAPPPKEALTQSLLLALSCCIDEFMHIKDMPILAIADEIADGIYVSIVLPGETIKDYLYRI